MRRISSATATSSIPRPEWVASKSGYRSRRDAARNERRVRAYVLRRRHPRVTCEGNSMKDTRRAFILAAGSTAATMSLPREVVRAADDAARNSKEGLAVDYRAATDLIALLQTRQVSAVELLDRAIARIEAHDGKLNAVVVRDFERARAVAIEADRALARGEGGPLLGLPMTVKNASTSPVFRPPGALRAPRESPSARMP